MGVHCEINLFNLSSNAVYLPGSNVSGIIKYALDEDTEFSKITVSLKGHGCLRSRERNGRKGNRRSIRNDETYVDVDDVIFTNENKSSLAIGQYETGFNFKLPVDIPASLKCVQRSLRYKIKCNIVYYIRIKFDKPGLFQFAKRFKKELNVVAGIKPRLLTEPIMYGNQKKLIQLFSNRSGIVNTKVTIENSVIKPGEKIAFNYEIFNDTNVNIKGVEIKLIEVYTFTNRSNRKVKITKELDNTDSKTGSIPSGDTKNIDIEMCLPLNVMSLDFSNIIARDYFIKITANIPFPHLNAHLVIPVQIGEVLNVDSVEEMNQFNDPPPSYWEVMSEEEKKEKYEDFDDVDK